MILISEVLTPLRNNHRIHEWSYGKPWSGVISLLMHLSHIDLILKQDFPCRLSSPLIITLSKRRMLCTPSQPTIKLRSSSLSTWLKSRLSDNISQQRSLGFSVCDTIKLRRRVWWQLSTRRRRWSWDVGRCFNIRHACAPCIDVLLAIISIRAHQAG